MTQARNRDVRDNLLRRGRALELTTLAWNVVGVLVLAIAALSARSVALAGFGLDSVIEIGASAVVLWELADVSEHRRERAVRLIGTAFIGLSLYLAVQSTVVLVAQFHPRHSALGMAWTALTVVVMGLLARGKALTGATLANPVLVAEGRVTLLDAILAATVLIGLALNSFVGWWWADPAAGYVLVLYAVREAHHSYRD